MIGPLELAAPHLLTSDPRSWPARGSITAVRFEGDTLVVEWDGVDQWASYDVNGRAFYGHLGAVIRDERRAWRVCAFEHLADSPTGSGVDTRFETLADPVSFARHCQLPDIAQPLETELVYLFAAAPFRPGSGPTYPQDEGLDPVRTEIVAVRWGRNGVHPAEPTHWWQGTDDTDDTDTDDTDDTGDGMKVEDLSRYRGGIHWQEVEAAYDASAGEDGASQGEYECGTVRDDAGEWLYAIEHWRGLFGGVPGGWKPDVSPESKPLEFLALTENAKLNGQSQEITQVPMVYTPGRNKGLRILGTEDLHRPDTSGTFEGSRGPIQLVHPIHLPKGTKLTVRFIVTQEHKGAHMYTVFHTSTTDPRR